MSRLSARIPKVYDVGTFYAVSSYFQKGAPLAIERSINVKIKKTSFYVKRQN
jgi:hypothetical protein